MRKIVYIDNFLTNHGHTPTTGSTLVQLFREEGYQVIWTSRRQNKIARLADMLLTIYKNRENAVVLIATYSTSAFYFACACAYLCKFLEVPYVPCLHGGNLPVRIKRSSALSRKLFSNSYTNVAVSGYLQKSLLENNWKCTLIPNSIDLASYPFYRKTSCSPSLLWVRSFHKIYNPLLAIRIIKALTEKYPDSTLTMVGPDKDGSLDECKKLVAELKLEKQVSFKGLLSRDNWVKLAASHNIFINTTNFDNLPVSVVEAMALGMAVVSTNVGGIPYLITNLNNGILVPEGNEEAFVTTIERIIADNALAKNLSHSARTKAEEFAWNNIRLLWNGLFNNIKSKATIVDFYNYVVKPAETRNKSLWNRH